MAVSARYMIAAAVLALGAGAFGASTAYAGCGGCNGGPPTVQPPPNPTPPPNCSGARPGCGGGGVKIVVPPVNIPTPNVSVNYGSTVTAFVNQSSNVGVSVGGGGGGFFIGGGGFVGDVDPGVTGGQVPMLAAAQTAITREITAERVIQASCIDDRNAQHDASQTFGEARVSTSYTGEIYRCMAGTKMRVLVGEFKNGQPSFDGARSFECAKGEALVYNGQAVECRVQEAKRPCNERSLLRRFGPGVKVITLRETQTTQVDQRQLVATSAAPIGFDGGVGQSVW